MEWEGGGQKMEMTNIEKPPVMWMLKVCRKLTFTGVNAINTVGAGGTIELGNTWEKDTHRHTLRQCHNNSHTCWSSEHTHEQLDKLNTKDLDEETHLQTHVFRRWSGTAHPKQITLISFQNKMMLSFTEHKK